MEHLPLAAQEPLELKVLDPQHRPPLVHGPAADVLRRGREVRHEGGGQQREVRNLLQIFLHALNLDRKSLKMSGGMS